MLVPDRVEVTGDDDSVLLVAHVTDDEAADLLTIRIPRSCVAAAAITVRDD